MRPPIRAILGLVGTAGVIALSACGAIVSTDGYAGDPLTADGGSADVTTSDVQSSGNDAGSTCPGVDLMTDAENCGACKKVCSGSQLCDNGKCTDKCEGGRTACGRSCVDINSDAKNCGGCLRACPGGTNAEASCSLSVCGLKCNANFGDCDGKAANGCEANLTNDAANCGTCGKTCAGGSNADGICTASECKLQCAAGFGDCDANASTGCERDLRNNQTSCGACDVSCDAVPNANATCTGLACNITSCKPNFDNCDGKADNGCEQKIIDDVGNCGACNKACTAANGTPSCTGTTCGIASCNAGFDDCDKNLNNGCEATLTNNNAACGACNVQCGVFGNGSSKCSGTACVVDTCSANYADCDKKVETGCEVYLRTVDNCTACGKKCAFANGTSSCDSGACTLTGCNAPFDNCDGVATNGCETTTQTSAGACGVCSKVCPEGQICSGGNCVPPTGGPSTCVAGCSCPTNGAQLCSRACQGANCALDCGSNANCNYTCDAGGCTLNTSSSSRATLSCKGGGCKVNVATFANIELDCDGGGCTVNAGSSATVTVHCPGGNCKLDCGNSSICKMDDCAAGTCNMDCTATFSRCELSQCTKNCVTKCSAQATCTNTCKDLSAGCVF